MTSPARQHLLRQSAIQAAQQDPRLLRHSTGYELLLQKLNADMKTLKKTHSTEKKAELKRSMLPDYVPWVDGVLSEGKGAQDAILMTIMVWRIDAGDYAGALEIARYALKHKLSMPFGSRPAAYVVVEEIADMSTRAYAAGEPVSLDVLMTTMELTETQDMPDQVRAKLHKITGYVYRAAEKPTLALEHLKRAFQLNANCGVKKDIERLESAIKKAANG
jgi:hypothetical protein